MVNAQQVEAHRQEHLCDYFPLERENVAKAPGIYSQIKCVHKL